MSTVAASILRRAREAGDLVINEMFLSVQGEGPSAGQAAAFLRLGGCNLDCGAGPGARWACDTPHTWQWSEFDPGKELRPVSVGDIAAYVNEHSARRVVITGGEPLLQQDTLAPLVSRLSAAGRLVEFETNGTIAPAPDLVASAAQFNVSPKLATSGVRRSKRISPTALASLAMSGKAVFKFVIADPARDVPEVEDLARVHGLDPVWLLPAGTDADTVLSGMSALTGPATRRGWAVSPRLHVLMWGDERGR